jgi:ubiquinol-cytochrome c reductase iron-sulfur subunit
MSIEQKPPHRRRDLLTTSALVLSAGGLLAAFWPVVSAIQPDAETQARQKIFNTSSLATTGQALVTVNATPVLIFRRSPQELAALDRSHAKGSAMPAHRSQRPNIMVVSARCPHDACTVVRNETYTGAVLLCPCCRSTFDLAGRRTAGPATTDLEVPAHRYLSDYEIEMGGTARQPDGY